MRLIVLDTGTLGLLTNPLARPDALACRQWAQARLASGARMIVPGIADYELTRELIRAGKTSGNAGSTRPDPASNSTRSHKPRSTRRPCSGRRSGTPG
jgi:hypothetical protein